MKIKFLALTGLAGLAVAVYYFKLRHKTKGISTYENIKKQTANGERHIRDVMKKSKLAL
jgi:hypothetical protein